VISADRSRSDGPAPFNSLCSRGYEIVLGGSPTRRPLWYSETKLTVQTRSIPATVPVATYFPALFLFASTRSAHACALWVQDAQHKVCVFHSVNLIAHRMCLGWLLRVVLRQVFPLYDGALFAIGSSGAAEIYPSQAARLNCVPRLVGRGFQPIDTGECDDNAHSLIAARPVIVHSIALTCSRQHV